MLKGKYMHYLVFPRKKVFDIFNLTELTGKVACQNLVKSKSESHLGYGVLKIFDLIFQQVGLLGLVLLISLIFRCSVQYKKKQLPYTSIWKVIFSNPIEIVPTRIDFIGRLLTNNSSEFHRKILQKNSGSINL